VIAERPPTVQIGGDALAPETVSRFPAILFVPDHLPMAGNVATGRVMAI
jgi:hypothetical protein